METPRLRWPPLPLLIIVALVSILFGISFSSGGARPSVVSATGDLHLIKHVVIIMQENRSFDSYFGTFPGADGIPTPLPSGTPSVCLPDPRPIAGLPCQAPYYNPKPLNYDNPHHYADALMDINGGQMDGFLQSAWAACQSNPVYRGWDRSCTTPPGATPVPWDVMGYHDYHDLPNYWAYAHRYVLQDHMFAPMLAWSLPSHLYLLSNWSATCSISGDPASCTNNATSPQQLIDYTSPVTPTGAQPYPSYAWAGITLLLDKNTVNGVPAPVSWRYYTGQGTLPDCPAPTPVAGGGGLCTPAMQPVSGTYQIWNPLPFFTVVTQGGHVQSDGSIDDVRPLSDFFKAAATNSLPAVSWLAPSFTTSEHPPALTTLGQAYSTLAIDAIMNSSSYTSTAIFLAWDDWGGFYDHVPPYQVDQNGYGIRVPGLVISAYAKPCTIDSQILSLDAYNRFIEDDFLNGQRLDPQTDNWPDNRPTVRETLVPGDLQNDFNWQQTPIPPILLPLFPRPGAPTPTPLPGCS